MNQKDAPIPAGENMDSVSEIREWMDKAFTAFALPREPQGLYAPVAYMMAIGGKRIRPMLCLLGYHLFTGRVDNGALFPAIGIEIFHTFTLVHDDIMDRAPTRRNQPTVHHKWNTNTAILSGDVMCITAYQYLCRAHPQHQADILRLFNRTAAQVCEGQQWDMDYEQKTLVGEDEYLRMIELKTAVLMAAAAKIGALAGGADAQAADTLYELGRLLGLAFQIQDDVLDAYGEAGVFGKNIGNDIVNNKKTFLLVLALQQAEGGDREQLDALLTDTRLPPEQKINDVRAIYRRLQVRQQAEARIADYFNRALRLLESIPVKPEYKQPLYDFTLQFIGREK
jgi:geranylgeranyl diphosphate synthase type II